MSNPHHNWIDVSLFILVPCGVCSTLAGHPLHDRHAGDLTNLVFSINTLYPSNPLLSSLVPVSDGLCHIAATASVLTIAITVESFYAVCSSFTYQTREVEREHWWILSSYIMPVMLTATMLNIPKLLHLSKMDFMKNIFKHNRGKYIKFDIISQLFHPLSTTCLLSIIILCFLTYRIFLGSKRIVCMSTNTDKSMAKIMMTIVAVFILFSIPKASSHCSKSQPSPSS